jgi:hypothetical protein
MEKKNKICMFSLLVSWVLTNNVDTGYLNVARPCIEKLDLLSLLQLLYLTACSEVSLTNHLVSHNFYCSIVKYRLQNVCTSFVQRNLGVLGS